MTNPNNTVGTNGAFGGRTSVNAFNDVMGAFQSRGVLSGWGIVPSSGMTVSCGGAGTVRDVAVAADPNGNKTSVNNISGAPILVTLDSAPASNSRYDAIVVYVDKPPTGNATQDNPECCGIIKVTGTAASTPAYPTDGAIRSAITADGASGATAYYAILGYVLVAAGTTAITSGMITGAGNPMLNVIVGNSQIQDGAVTTDKIANSAVKSNKVDFTKSTVAVTIGGRSVNANKVDLGNGLTLVGGSFVLFNYTVSGTSTNIKIQGIPQMSSVFSVSAQAMQIGQAHSYTAYGYINPSNYSSMELYIEGTTAGTNNLQVHFSVVGILA